MSVGWAYGAGFLGVGAAILIGIGFNDFCSRRVRLILSIIGCIFLALAFAIFAYVAGATIMHLHKLHHWLMLNKGAPSIVDIQAVALPAQ